jgi:hypothetical protein
MGQGYFGKGRPVKLIVVPYNNQRDAAGEAIAMSQWCRDMGLERNTDYDWTFMTGKKEIHFRFFGNKESYSTMFALKWAGNEI